MFKFEIKSNEYDYSHLKNGGSFSWRSPSNIAVVKYWGKYGIQLPANPSLSMTLSESYTETTVTFNPSTTRGVSVDLLFEGSSNEKFENRLLKYLVSISTLLPFLNLVKLEIESRNSFPHSAGIASSASAMSALALCLCSIENLLLNGAMEKDKFDIRASYLARLGSGSASRSIYAPWAVWGSHSDIEGSSDEFAIKLDGDISHRFSNLRDTILITESGKKKVSSSTGHNLMNSNPYAENRFRIAGRNISSSVNSIYNDDMKLFGELLEHEALNLHGLMMSSIPGYILINGNTINIIEKVRDFRKDTDLPFYFTLDAGPNVHLIYPEDCNDTVNAFIESELKQFCENGMILHDSAGSGPEPLFTDE